MKPNLEKLIIYESENLKLYSRTMLVSVLRTDHGFFTDEFGNDIGQVINISVSVDSDNNKIYIPHYLKVTQHFPGNYSWTWVYKDGGYVREN